MSVIFVRSKIDFWALVRSKINFLNFENNFLDFCPKNLIFFNKIYFRTYKCPKYILERTIVQNYAKVRERS
jgi:hypothetical protein